MMITRFAPSPTGLLHLGHVWSALVAHDLARAHDGRFLLRIDDIDGARSRPSYHQAILDDLVWLGLQPDGPALVQSTRADAYSAALDRLGAMGLTYPCFCTRAEIAAEISASANAPHWPMAAIYPGTCRYLSPSEQAQRLADGRTAAIRLDMANATAHAARIHGPLHWQDAERGTIVATPMDAGDIVLARRDALASYHLSSTVDDAFCGVTNVVRGSDLVNATHIHRLLQALLDLPVPRYHHHRLIGDASSGQRLAKRDAAATIAGLRDAGIDPTRLIADLRVGTLPVGYCWISA